MFEHTLKPSKRSGALDLLRFFAVLYVFFGHYTDNFNTIYQIVPENFKYIPVARYANSALILFFMISGYVVTMTSVKRNIREFVIARLSRIYPLFWVSCICAFVLPRIVHAHSFLGYYPLKTLIFNLTMFPAAFGYPMINPVFHTLVAEMGFYFLIAIIILFRLWKKIIHVITILMTLCILNIIFFDYPVYVGIFPFVAGMLFYLIKAGNQTPWKLYTLLLINFVCAMIGSKVMTDSLDAFTKQTHNVIVIPAIITFYYVLLFLIARNKLIIKSSILTEKLGEIAYPFYLFHIYFLCFYWYFRDKIQADILLFGILILVILVSWFINMWVEKPLSRIAHHVLTLITTLVNKAKNVSTT